MKKPFTLIEVLVAMSVLTVFLLGLMQFYSSTESMLSSGIERTEMFERARVAMDMMANDLVCIYYSQTDKKAKTYDFSGESFKVSTVRPEKLQTTAKTNIVGVKYEWNRTKKNLVYSFDANGDAFDISKANCGNDTVLVEGVSDFDVKAYAKGSNLPALVVIRMELIDSKSLRRYKANDNETIIKNAPKREFRRMVIIDRGQPKPELTFFAEGSH